MIERLAPPAAALLLLLALAACSPRAGQQRAAPPPVPLVEAVEARFGALPIEAQVPGVVRARNQVAIRPEIEARVVEVLVRSGEAVERGQELVRLDPTGPRERLRQAEADVRLAEASAAAARARVAEIEARVARSRALAAEELLSDQELETLEAELAAVRAGAEEAEARVEQARAVVEERRSALARTVVRAPVAGRLGERRVEVGMMVDPSTLLFVVGNLDELIVEVTLGEEVLDVVEEGQPVVIESPAAAGEPIRAELSRLSPFLAAESFTAVGEIDVDDRGRRLRPGMFVDVTLLVGESRRAVLVPLAALWRDPASGERGVFVVEQADGLAAPAAGAAVGADTPTPEEARRVVFRRVEVVAEGRGAAGVEGIESGAWVVTVGQHLIGDGRLAARVPPGESGEAGPAARVRPVPWERVAGLQSLQDEDLLDEFLAKQRAVAAALGAEIPESEDEVDRVMAEAAASEPAAADGSRR